MSYKSISNYLKIYIIYLSFFAIFYLFFKHTVLNDSSISEWLINYQGGFTRRGLSGEFVFIISDFFDLKLRFVIFLLQTFFHLLYLYLIFIYFKNIKLNIIQIFALFSPIFLLYPIAEIEVLGRKEIILFSFYVSMMIFCQKDYSKDYINYSTFFFLPLICLIWEQVILFAPYILVLVIIKNQFKTFKKTFIRSFIIFLPTILAITFIFLNPLSQEGHKEMCDALLNKFGERCYMSAHLLVVNTVYFNTWNQHETANLINYLRYLGIFFVGFLPLHYLLFKSRFTSKNNFINKNFKLENLFFLLYLPSIIIFMFAWDWGRWINILYSFSILLYFYLYKNGYITFKNVIFPRFLIYIRDKKLLLIPIFIIFAFGWHPKATLSEDIGSLPGYRIPYKATKFINTIKIRFQNNEYNIK
tara:strand:+ start:3959 stop:5203 length:1245 start_codon:yes stop_codon:yes gene_type:complete